MSYIGIGESNKAKRGNAREAGGRQGLLVSFALAERAHQNEGQEVDGRLLLQRRINRMAVSFFGSANLVRPGLRPNGPSNIASRHRHLGKGRVLARPGLGG